MKLIHKLIDFSIGQVDEEARTFWAVASTNGVDRQGDSIEAVGWDLSNFMKNPVIPWAHDYMRPPVAKALECKVEDGRLVFHAQFPPAEDYKFSDTVFRLYRGGFLRAFSVGFSPIESEMQTIKVGDQARTGTLYRRQELYEISCVTLPANPQALLAASIINPSQALVAATSTPSRAAAQPDMAAAMLDRLLVSRLKRALGRD